MKGPMTAWQPSKDSGKWRGVVLRENQQIPFENSLSRSSLTAKASTHEHAIFKRDAHRIQFSF